MCGGGYCWGRRGRLLYGVGCSAGCISCGSELGDGRSTFLPITPRQAIDGIVTIVGCKVECVVDLGSCWSRDSGVDEAEDFYRALTFSKSPTPVIWNFGKYVYLRIDF